MRNTTTSLCSLTRPISVHCKHGVMHFLSQMNRQMFVQVQSPTVRNGPISWCVTKVSRGLSLTQQQRAPEPGKNGVVASAFIGSHPCHPWCNRISFDIKQICDGVQDSRKWLSMEDGVLLRAISRWWMRRGDIVVFTWKTNLLTFFSSSGTSRNTEKVKSHLLWRLL